MNKEEAIKILRAIHNGALVSVREALETLIPELRESEDERIINQIISLIKEVQEDEDWHVGKWSDDAIEWLEKQKEQPQEELIYRMNGLMQEYIKEGKDEAEKEHRFKCYHLFWDALEDANFFEQKEQKHPNGCFTCDEYKKGYEAGRLNGFTAGYNKAMKEQKPVEWSDTNELVFNDICRHLENEGYSGWVVLLNALRNGEFQPKQEWSEEDKKMIDTIVSVLGQYIDYKVVSGTGSGYATPRYNKEIAWLNSLPHRFSLSSWGEEIQTAFFGKVNKEAWRPSEEQMEALKNSAYGTYQNGDGPALRELYEQLKKL